MAGYLANTAVDLRIDHDRSGSSSDPSVISFMTVIVSTSGRLHSELLFIMNLESER